VSIDTQAIRAQYPLLDIASRYVDLRKKGREHVGLCPFHADANPSLTVYRATDGFERFRCFPCGAHGDVIDFVREYESVDLPEAVRRITGGQLPPQSARPPQRDTAPDESEVWVPIVPIPDDAPAYDPARTYNPRRARFVTYRPERQDVYRDAEGRVLFYVVRLNIDGDKLCPVVSYCEGPGGERRWCTRRPKPPYPLHGLDDLAARPKAPVLVVSGEKCREEAAAAIPRMVVVSWLGGDETVKAADITPLAGRSVTFWPDADDSGRRAMSQLAARIQALNV
jgi:hypothetical protein